MLRLPGRFPLHRIRSGVRRCPVREWMTQIFGLELLPTLFLWFESHACGSLAVLCCAFPPSWRTGRRLALTVRSLVPAALRHAPRHRCIRGRGPSTSETPHQHRGSSPQPKVRLTAWLSTLSTQVYCLKTCETNVLVLLFMVRQRREPKVRFRSSVQFSRHSVRLFATPRYDCQLLKDLFVVISGLNVFKVGSNFFFSCWKLSPRFHRYSTGNSWCLK